MFLLRSIKHGQLIIYTKSYNQSDLNNSQIKKAAQIRRLTLLSFFTYYGLAPLKV
jgi:hypothetical protein